MLEKYNLPLLFYFSYRILNINTTYKRYLNLEMLNLKNSLVILLAVMF